MCVHSFPCHVFFSWIFQTPEDSEPAPATAPTPTEEESEEPTLPEIPTIVIEDDDEEVLGPFAPLRQTAEDQFPNHMWFSSFDWSGVMDEVICIQ